MGNNKSSRINQYTIDDVVEFFKINSSLSPHLSKERAKPASWDTIDELEKRLEIKLPEDYRRFLSEFGYLLIGTRDFHGVFDNDLDRNEFSALRLTLANRQYSNMPHYYVAIYDDDGDEQWCLDTREEHANIIVWDFFEQCVVREFATDFVNTIFDVIEEEIEYIEKDGELEEPIQWPVKKN